MTKFQLGLITSVSICIASCTGAARAEVSAPATPASQDQGDADIASPTGGRLDEIVVTANRRSESQQKVPITISAFTGETLDTLGIRSAVDLPQITPGLSLTRTLAGSNAFLRGVGVISSGYTSESPIATYIDGLYLPNAAASAFSFNNIQRIEVLKGPQGTLYGRNSTGGLINVITKEPGDVTSIDVSASYANYDTFTVNGYASTPVSENLSFNVAGLYINQTDGWGRNVFLGTQAYKFKDFGIQTKLKWEPTPETTITLRGLYDRFRTDQGGAAAVFPGSIGVDGTTFQGRYRTNTRIDPSLVHRQGIVSLKMEQELDFATLTSLTGYIKNKTSALLVLNGIPGNPVSGQSASTYDSPQRSKTFSQELQLTSSTSGSDLQWIMGLYYYRDVTDLNIGIYGTCVGTVCAGAPVPTRTISTAGTRSYAGYGEATYSVTPTTRATIGLRYTLDKKTLEGAVTPFPGRPNTPVTLSASTVLRAGDPYPGNPAGLDTDTSFGKLTFKAVLAQDIGDDVHAYASFNRGFKAGGYAPTAFNNPPYRPEVLDAYEVGVKSELFDRMLRLNVSAFLYDYKDIQLRTSAPPAAPGFSIVYNAAAARIKGIDVDFVLALAPGLTINGGGEILDAEFTDFRSTTCTVPRAVGGAVLGGVTSIACDLTGYRLPNAPELSFNLGFTYSVETEAGSFAITANDGYKSSSFWEPDNRLKQKAFHLVNASITFTPPQSRFSLQLFGKNLLNEYYFARGAEGSAGNDIHVPAAPRTYGAMLRYTF